MEEDPRTAEISVGAFLAYVLGMIVLATGFAWFLWDHL